MDQRTRKLASHPRDDIDRLYVSRKEGGRGLASIQDSTDTSIQRIEDYIHKRGGRLITAIRNNTDNAIINNRNNQKKKMGKKINLSIFQVTNKQNLIRENLNMAKKGKPFKWNWIFSDSRIK